MKSRNSFFAAFLMAIFFLLITVHSCTKNITEPDKNGGPHNPYDDIIRGDTTKYGIPVDSLTVTYVHKKVLSTRCALPGCHDGHFEPDFRTPQSSFSTLVYASVIKHNLAGAFKYRVVPFNIDSSVLHERITNCCFVYQDDRMPQDNIGVPLPDSSINLIAAWILHGARDMFGNIARLPNNEPKIEAGYVAFDTVSLIPPFAFPSIYYSNDRLDSVYYNPFVVPSAKSVFYMIFKVSDDSTSENQLQYNKLKISTSEDNFTGAWQYNALYFNAGGNNTGYLVTIPTSSLPQNDTLFFRYYVNDGDHPVNTEFPRSEMLFPYKTFWSFIRQ